MKAGNMTVSGVINRDFKQFATAGANTAAGSNYSPN